MLRPWRHQDDVDAVQIDATIARQALIAVFGDHAARIGYRYEEGSVSTTGLPRPGVREELTQQKLGQVVERIQDNLFDIQLTIDALEYDSAEDRVVIRIAGTDLLLANLASGIDDDGLQVPQNNYSIEEPIVIWPESNPLQAPRGDPDPLIRTLLVLVLALGGGVVFLLDRRRKDAALLRAARTARF